MAMNMGTISYWFYEAFESMRKNIKNVLISISTMLATLLIIAIGYAVLKNANFIMEQKQKSNSKIIAFLDANVTSAQVKAIQSKLVSEDGVVDTEYYSSQDGEETFVPDSNKDSMTSGFDEETFKTIFPPTVVVTFDKIEAQDHIIATLRGMEGVGKGEKDVQVSSSAKDAILNAKRAIIVSTTAMILLIELAIILMINNTKLMMYARRKEISIMKYVGAKDGFIKMPFAIEGIITSLIAVIIVLVLFHFSYDSVIEMIGTKASFKYMKLPELMPNLTLMLVVISFLIGTIGSTVSMKKYLEV